MVEEEEEEAEKSAVPCTTAFVWSEMLGRSSRSAHPDRSTCCMGWLSVPCNRRTCGRRQACCWVVAVRVLEERAGRKAEAGGGGLQEQQQRDRRKEQRGGRERGAAHVAGWLAGRPFNQSVPGCERVAAASVCVQWMRWCRNKRRTVTALADVLPCWCWLLVASMLCASALTATITPQNRRRHKRQAGIRGDGGVAAIHAGEVRGVSTSIIRVSNMIPSVAIGYRHTQHNGRARLTLGSTNRSRPLHRQQVQNQD